MRPEPSAAGRCRSTALPHARFLAALATPIVVLALALGSPRTALAGLLDDLFAEIGAPHPTGASEAEILIEKLQEKGVLTETDRREIEDAISEERAFRVDVGGMIQPRAIPYTGSDHVEGVPGDPKLWPGFQLRRARLNAGGQAYWSWLRYFVQLDLVSKTDPTKFKVELADASILAVDLIPFQTIRLGLGKPPFARQHLASTSKLQFQERSVVVTEMSRTFFDREIGLTALGRIPVLDEALLVKYGVGVFNGNGKQGVTGDLNEGKMAAVRGQIDLFRDLGLDEGDLVAGHFGASLGGGYFYNRDVASEPQGYTVDAEARWMGASLTGAYLQVDYKPDLEEGIDFPEFATSFKMRGWYAQAGVMLVPRLLEVVGRYEMFDSNDQIDDNGDVSAVTGGVNVYLADHDLKLSLDYVGRMEDEGAKLENDSLTLEVALVF